MYLTLETLAGGPQICYYHYDGLGSVTDLSNSSGEHIEHYYYDPFGNTRIYDPATSLKRTDSIISNPYRFTARRWDSESSLYYYRARMYDPNLGRFLQTDPIGYNAGDTNLYRYCGNNPINLVDPLGLEGKPEKERKRPNETWDEYWARRKQQRALKWLGDKLRRAKRLVDIGMKAAAALALVNDVAAMGRAAWNREVMQRLKWAAEQAAMLTPLPGPNLEFPRFDLDISGFNGGGISFSDTQGYYGPSHYNPVGGPIWSHHQIVP